MTTKRLSIDAYRRLVKQLRDKIDAKNAEILNLKQEVRIAKELYEEVRRVVNK